MEINEEIFRERGQELELYDEDDYEQLEEERIKEEE